MRHRMTLILAGSLAVLCTGGAAVVATTTASAHSSVLHLRPSARSGSVTPNTTPGFVTANDQFQSNAGGWCVGAGPCDGNVTNGDYGPIDAAIPGGFSNGGYGDYAPNTSALFNTKMALISGSTQADQGFGCQTPGVEGCTGPYYLPGGGTAAENVFPSSGFTVTDDIYLDPSASLGNADEIDLDVALNNSAGGFAQDMIFAVCNQGGGTGYSVTFGHNSPGDCSGSPAITSAGWYRFVWLFTNVGGKVFLTQRVLAETGLSSVADSGPQPVIFPGDSTAEPVSNVGGIAYAWFPTLQVEGMPMANFAIQQGQHGSGHTP